MLSAANWSRVGVGMDVLPYAPNDDARKPSITATSMFTGMRANIPATQRVRTAHRLSSNDVNGSWAPTAQYCYPYGGTAPYHWNCIMLARLLIIKACSPSY